MARVDYINSQLASRYLYIYAYCHLAYRVDLYRAPNGCGMKKYTMVLCTRLVRRHLATYETLVVTVC